MDNVILFNCSTNFDYETTFFFGFVENGELILLNSEKHFDNEYDKVDSYMEENFSDFDESCDAHWERENELSFDDNKNEMKIMCEKMIVDGFVYSDNIGQLGKIEYSLDGANEHTPLFFENDFK